MTTDEFLRRQIIPLAYRQLPARELMARATAGDPEAFIALVCLKFSHVEGVCREALGHAGSAEDVALETFVQLWRQREKVRDPKAIDGWLVKTAGNLARKQVAAQARGRAAGREWWRRTAAGASPSPPDRAVIQEEIVRRVRLALAEQSDGDQGLLWTAEHTSGDAQAAEALGLSVPTYRVRLHRARQKLRVLLRKYGVTPVVGTLAIVGTARNRAASAVAALWETTGGKALLLGLMLSIAVTIVGWALGRDSEPAVVQVAPKFEPATQSAVAVESLQSRNRRIVENDLAPELRDIVQRFYPPDNTVLIAGVRAFGSEVEVEFQATHPPPPSTGMAARMRGRYCTFRRRLVVHGQPSGETRWYKMNPLKPYILRLPGPFGLPFDVVRGREEFAASERLFDQLPRDSSAESEHLRFLFGLPGKELRLPAWGNGFCIDGNRMWFVDGDHSLYARDSAGGWRYDGECPGWWLVARDGHLYCISHDRIVTRPIDSPDTAWVLWRNAPAIKAGERLGFLAIGGDRFFISILPHVFCHCPLADPEAPWVREVSRTPVWPDGIAATADRLFGHDSGNVVSRPVRDESAPWTPVARLPEGGGFLAVDGERLLLLGKPGPIYARPLTAGPEVDWEVAGKAHEPLRR